MPVGGFLSRRAKPMARAFRPSALDVTDLTVVTYGGPTWGFAVPGASAGLRRPV